MVLWLLASACVVAVRAGLEATDSDLWLLAVVRCDCAAAGMHVRSGRDPSGAVGAVHRGSTNRGRGWGQPLLLCIVMAASELMGARVFVRQGPFAAWRRANAKVAEKEVELRSRFRFVNPHCCLSLSSSEADLTCRMDNHVDAENTHLSST